MCTPIRFFPCRRGKSMRSSTMYLYNHYSVTVPVRMVMSKYNHANASPNHANHAKDPIREEANGRWYNLPFEEPRDRVCLAFPLRGVCALRRRRVSRCRKSPSQKPVKSEGLLCATRGRMATGGPLAMPSNHMKRPVTLWPKLPATRTARHEEWSKF